MILDYFVDDKVPIVTYRRAGATKPGGVVTPGAESEVENGNGIYWEGAAAVSLVSERFRDTTKAAISVPVSWDVKKSDRVNVQSKDYYALDSDNVGAADEHQLVALEIRS